LAGTTPRRSLSGSDCGLAKRHSPEFDWIPPYQAAPSPPTELQRLRRLPQAPAGNAVVGAKRAVLLSRPDLPKVAPKWCSAWRWGSYRSTVEWSFPLSRVVTQSLRRWSVSPARRLTPLGPARTPGRREEVRPGRQKCVQALERDGARGCDLDADSTATSPVVDNQQAIRRSDSPRAFSHLSHATDADTRRTGGPCGRSPAAIVRSSLHLVDGHDHKQLRVNVGRSSRCGPSSSFRSAHVRTSRSA
jgi:hypothetical protein